MYELQTLNILLPVSALTHTVDPTPYETETYASTVITLTCETMYVKDLVHGFLLSFEVDRHLYDIVEVTQCLHSVVVSTFLGLFLNT